MRVLLAFLFVGGVFAVPINRRNEEEFCETGSTRFLPNVRYTYHYVATTVTGVTGTTNETTGLKISAKCDVEALGQCRHILKMRNVELFEATPHGKTPYHISAGYESFRIAVESNDLFFTANNGRIAKISPANAEPVYVTNFKRGILSALQLEFTEEPLTVVPEVDVSGNCTTEYKVVEVNETDTEVTKTKNLTQCTMRSHNISTFNVVNYEINSTVQTPLNSTSRCRFVVENHIKTVQCNETHLLRPFSYQGAGVTTNVTLNLTLESTRRTFFFDYESGERRTSTLVYEHISKEDKDSVYEETSKAAEAILEDLITTLPLNETKPLTATKFANLLVAIRKLDTEALKEIWTRFYTCEEQEEKRLTEEQCKKSQAFLIDAVTQCGTVPCMRFIIDAIQEYNRVKPEHVTSLLSGMSLVRKPSYIVFTEVLDLLNEKEDLPKTTLLSLGTMIRKYCKQVPADCTREVVSEVMDAVDYLENQLPAHCEATPETVDDVIVTLKAIGNAGRTRSKATELVKCAQGANYLNVSVIAIETIRRMPYCPDTWKALKWDVFSKYSVDPEVRMHAYFALMKYPMEKTVKFVAEVLDMETNTQVGALVYSHLKHMNESVEPTYGKTLSAIIKKALKQRETPLREFNTTRKSRFMQRSYFNDEYNLGFSTESHVFYHPESLLPRSAELNVTVDVLGGAFPVLETSTRFEGLEILWEKLFGHDGYFPDNHIRGLVDTPEENYVDNPVKRSTDNLIDIETLDQKVNLRKMTPSGFLSLKLFGNELDIFTLKDLEWLQEDDIPLADIIDVLQKLSKGVNKTYTKSVVFLEESYVIPTCLGIPLNLSVNGTAVSTVHVEGKVDVRGLFWGKKNAVIKGTVKPTTAVVLSGQVTLDAIHHSTGVLLNSTIVTSTELQGNLTYKEGEGLKAHVNVTDKPQEILNITTALFQHVNNIKTPIQGVTHRNTTGICTTDVFNSTNLFGLNLCSNISMPVAWYNKTAPFFPLTGPANFSIYLNRTDPLLRVFKLEANITKPDNHTNKTIIAFCTPGASLERRFFLNITTYNRTEEMSRWNISVGTSRDNASTIDYIHVPLSKAVNITVNVTRNLTVFYFHRTCAHTNKTKYGFAVNTTLFNRTVQHTFFVMNHTNRWFLETNTTVLNATTNATLTVLYLNTTINLNGNTTGNVTVNITHRPLNFTWYLHGLHNMTTMSTNVTLNVSCPTWNTTICNQNITVNLTYVNTTKEYRTQVNVSSNGTQMLSCYKAYVNVTDKNITTYYCNVTVLNKTASWNMTLTNTTNIKICHLNITHQNRSITLNTTWHYSPEVKNVSLNITYLNHSIVLSGSMKNFTLEKGICLNSTYYNGSHRNFTLLATCLSYVNATEQKSLIWNVTSLNTTFTLNTTWFANSTSRGILVNCSYHNRTLFNATATYSNTTTTTNLHFNFTAGNWTAELNHTLFSTELLPEVDQIRSINITHRVKNGSIVILNNTFTFSFFNSTMKKDVVLNLTFFNSTYGAQVELLNKTNPEVLHHLHHVVRLVFYTPNKTATWTGVVKNTTDILNLTSLLEYQPRKTLNHTFLWHKKLHHVNVSLEVLPNVTVSFNCSGTFNTSINVTANVTVYNHTLLWHGFVGNTSVVSNVTLWNRTVEFVTKTCNKSISAFFNLSTWHHHNKTAFNGSVTWYINATERVSFFNVSAQNVTWSLKMFSDNETHMNSTMYTLNGTEVYRDWSSEIRGNGTGYDVLNVTSLVRFWKAFNNVTYNIPAKIANITLNMTVEGVNMTKFRTHLKYVLKNVTHELLQWNYTTENFTSNLRNLSMHLLNVTSRSMPNVTANCSIYYHGNLMDNQLFYNNLAIAVYDINISNVTLANITEEIVVILQNFTGHVNTTAVLGNITNLITNTTWFNETLRNLTKRVFVAVYNLTDVTRNFTINFLNMTVGEVGNWTVGNDTVNYYLKEYLPTVHNFTVQLLNGTLNFTGYLQNVTLAIRNVTHNVTEYVLNVTHPLLYNVTRRMLVNITGYINGSSFLGGIVHPAWNKLTETLNISLFNFTYELIHNWTICNTSLEWFLPSLHHPVNATWTFHNITSNKTLYEAIEALLNKTLEVYNSTVRRPALFVNRTHERLVNFDVTIMNDTVNVLSMVSNKTTQEIVHLYINRTRNMTAQVWNMTVQLLTSTNFSKPLNETWKLLNFTTHYYNWTHCLPWSRPLLNKWNTSMFQVVSTMRNHTWQNYTRYYFPKLVRIAAYPIEVNVYMMALFFNYFPPNTTVTNETINTSFECPSSLKLNYTEFFYNFTTSYMNLTHTALNVTRNITELFLNSTYNFTITALNTTVNWTQTIYNLTRSVVNTTASFVNGSLVNETITHHVHKPGYFYFTSMNFTMNITDHALNYTVCLVNETVREFLNKTLSPIVTAYKTVKSVLEFRAENIVEMLQPENVTALMFGHHHFYTFDRRYFHFPGFQNRECQYLVARDFKDGNFTITTDSESISVMTNDAQVKIYRSGLVKSQGITNQYKDSVRDELPVKFENTSIVRDGPYINLTNDLGFSMECDMEHFVCSYIVSGFYHNRTAGLLGTNNGEPSDDWLSPTGKNRTRVSDFVNSWLVRGDEECKVERDVELEVPCNRGLPTKRCQELFLNDTSPLHNCFTTVNPADFARACVEEITDCDTSVASHCNVTAAYIRECQRHGIEIALPDDCTTCEVNGVVHKKNHTWKEAPNKRVDVVIVLSESVGMKPIAHLMPTFLQNLQDQLEIQMRSLRFGLVGFSGKPPVHRPGHVHTIKGRFFGSAKEFTRGLRNMEFVASEQETPAVNDGYLGLLKAAEYPFRPGATKIIILLTNSLRLKDSNVTLETVTQTLKNISARLVVIGDYRYKYAVAVDTFDRVYTKKAVEGHPIHKRSDKMLHYDEYVKVAMETQGAAVSLKKFESLPQDPKSWTFNGVYNSIMKQVMDDAKHCKECACVADVVGKGKTVCKTVLSCY